MTDINLELYIIGHSALSKRAIKNIKSICSDNSQKGQCRIEIIDLEANPGVAEQLKILAIPLLIKKFPLPQIRIIGDLSNEKKVRAALGLEQSNDEED